MLVPFGPTNPTFPLRKLSYGVCRSNIFELRSVLFAYYLHFQLHIPFLGNFLLPVGILIWMHIYHYCVLCNYTGVWDEVIKKD